MDAFEDSRDHPRRLAYALNAAGLEPADATLADLAAAYLHLALPGHAGALQSLGGRPRAILSTGSAAMLDALVHAELLGAAANYKLGSLAELPSLG